MSVESAQEAGRPAVVQYPIPLGLYRTHEAFDADAEASEILSVLAPLLGEHVVGWTVQPEGRHLGEVEARLLDLTTQPDSSTALVWVGHGRSNDQDAALIVPGVTSSPADGELLPAQLGTSLTAQSRRREHLEPRPWTLVLVEACGAGRFVELVNAHLQTVGGVNGVALIGIGDPNGHGHTATAGKILRQAVAAFDANDTLIRLSDLLIEVDERLGKGLWGVVASCRTAGYAIERPAIVFSATLDVYTELRRLLSELPADVQSHFARKGMGSDFGELTWSFVGRSAERTRIVDHLRRGLGLLAVTGPAGSGKSAVLGNVLLRSQPELRNVLVEAGFLQEDPPTPEETTVHVDAWIHLSGLTHREVLEELGDAAKLNLEPALTEVQLVDALLAAQQHRVSPLRVVADALDESRDPDTIAHTLKRLAAAGACIVVGTRPSLLEGPDHPAPDAHDLLDQLGVPAGAIVWVRRDSAALRTYLQRSFARELPDLAPPLQARILAATSTPPPNQKDTEGRGFLYARILISELKMRPDLDGPTLDQLLTGNHRTIFAAAMERLAEQEPVVADLLEALSHAQGNGIPRVGTVWATIARRLSSREVSPDDIEKALQLGAPYIAIGAEHGQAVYRLAHRTFEEHYEGPTRTETALRVTEGLIELAEQSRIDPNPYLVAYLAGHVARSGEPGWQMLAAHETLFDIIDYTSLVREMMLTSIGQVPFPAVLAGILSGIEALRKSAPKDRQAVISLNTARFARVETSGNEESTRLVTAALRRRTDTHLVMGGGHSSMLAVIPFATSHGRRLLATAGGDRTLRIWDPSSGLQVGEPMTGHTDRIYSVTAFFSASGRQLLATGSRDKTVRIWDPIVGRQVGIPLTGHSSRVNAIASFIRPDGRQLLATVSHDSTLRIWDPSTGGQVGNPVVGFSQLSALYAFVDSERRQILATGGTDNTVRLWDPMTGEQVCHGLQGHKDMVTAVTSFVGTDGRALLASASLDGTVRIWDPAMGQAVGDPLAGRLGRIRALTALMGEHGRQLLATGGVDGAVRMWDTSTGRQFGRTLVGHRKEVSGISSWSGADGIRWLATTSIDGTVRIWDPGTGTRALDQSTDVDSVVAIASYVDTQGRPMLATVGRNRRVRLWDPTARVHDGYRLRGPTSVDAITAFTGPDGRQLLVTADRSRRLQVWDPSTNRQIGNTAQGHTRRISAITALSTDGQELLATISFDANLRLWDPLGVKAVGKPRPLFSNQDKLLTAFTATDGRTILATAGRDRHVRLWELTGRPVGKIRLTDRVSSMTRYDDNYGRHLLVAATSGGSLQLWSWGIDRPQGEIVRSFNLHTSIRSMAQIADGAIAAGLADGWAVIQLRADL